MKILIIDDEEEILEYVSTFLIDSGHQVFTAQDGESSLSILEKEQPEIIFLDARMPGLYSGIDMIKKIKEITPQAKIYLVTGFDDIKREEMVQLGADDVIYKPVSLVKFQELIGFHKNRPPL